MNTEEVARVDGKINVFQAILNENTLETSQNWRLEQSSILYQNTDPKHTARPAM